MHRSILAGLGAAALVLGGMASWSAPASALGDGDYIGTVALVSGNYCPRNTMEAAGQELQTAAHSALYSLLGTTYGGNGVKTFNLPDLSDKSPVVGARYCIVIDGSFPSRN